MRFQSFFYPLACSYRSFLLWIAFESASCIIIMTYTVFFDARECEVYTPTSYLALRHTSDIKTSQPGSPNHHTRPIIIQTRHDITLQVHSSACGSLLQPKRCSLLFMRQESTSSTAASLQGQTAKRQTPPLSLPLYPKSACHWFRC